MSDAPRADEEYEPTEIDPDAPIDTVPREPQRPIDATDADWLDQEREVPLDDDEGDALAE
jgi:hypothetical protein